MKITFRNVSKMFRQDFVLHLPVSFFLAKFHHYRGVPLYCISLCFNQVLYTEKPPKFIGILFGFE